MYNLPFGWCQLGKGTFERRERFKKKYVFIHIWVKIHIKTKHAFKTLNTLYISLW